MRRTDFFSRLRLLAHILAVVVGFQLFDLLARISRFGALGLFEARLPFPLIVFVAHSRLYGLDPGARARAAGPFGRGRAGRQCVLEGGAPFWFCAFFAGFAP